MRGQPYWSAAPDAHQRHQSRQVIEVKSVKTDLYIKPIRFDVCFDRLFRLCVNKNVKNDIL